MGHAVEISLPPGTEPNGIFELVLPFQRKGNTGDDHYTVLRWDGSQWTNAGGLVEGDSIRVRINQFSTFAPAVVVWALRPVSFVNNGPYDAVVMPWTYQPLDAFAGVLPPNLAAASFAPGGPGLWPNSARFLGLPLGVYTFCVQWDEDQDLDLDNDCKTDYFHIFLEGPSTDLPILLDENDSIKLDFAAEVRFRTDVVGKLAGKCTRSAPQNWIVRLISEDVLSSNHPPDTTTFANTNTSPPSSNLSIENSGTPWESGDGQTIALMQEGQWISATCRDENTTAIGVRFEADDNDGWAQVLVAGKEVWTGSVYGERYSEKGIFRKYLEISGLSPGEHIIQVVCMGVEGQGGSIHVAVRYFGCASEPFKP
ncbi:MAG: hypothetical protein JEZ06_04960 [Anaerolineaceae bacterium]|nr:hypothetical protein [Anaerolineaceae bacterium]